ncbi:hypothetical protein PRZ61_09395 [Halomonas pacifica]|uniref:hypothetical protein n=1 Tax=Bisbaumannia pacifica TaxID=77098 RepID=UPI00235A11B9|nr:hypothetical protein [Halomonas pacifica]MDC8803654.1 hypothetical protein [Halomonas pacifica]
MFSDCDLIYLDDGGYRMTSDSQELRQRLDEYRRLSRYLEGLERRLAMMRTAQQRYLAELQRELAPRRFFWFNLGKLMPAQWSTPRRLRWQDDEVRQGDALLIYVNGQGALGMVQVTEDGYHWCTRAPRLQDAIGAGELRQTFHLSHPTRQLCRVDSAHADALFQAMKRRWQ